MNIVKYGFCFFSNLTGQNVKNNKVITRAYYSCSLTSKKIRSCLFRFCWLVYVSGQNDRQAESCPDKWPSGPDIVRWPAVTLSADSWKKKNLVPATAINWRTTGLRFERAWGRMDKGKTCIRFTKLRKLFKNGKQLILYQKRWTYLPARSTKLTIDVLVIIWPASFLPFWAKVMATMVWARLEKVEKAENCLPYIFFPRYTDQSVNQECSLPNWVFTILGVP